MITLILHIIHLTIKEANKYSVLEIYGFEIQIFI